MTYTVSDVKHLDLISSLSTKDGWLTCEKCGEKDITKPGHVGTKHTMRCNDCCTSEEKNNEHPHRAGYARLCRNCCPTAHGTKWEANASLDETILKLCQKLHTEGFGKYADELEKKFLQYKAAETHLYRAHDEDGEDLVERAHPDGDVNMGDGEHGDVETIVSQHKKIVDVIQKDPKGKLAEYIASCKVALGQDVKKKPGAESYTQLQGLPSVNYEAPEQQFSKGDVANYVLINGSLNKHLHKYSGVMSKLEELKKLIAPFQNAEVPDTTKTALNQIMSFIKNIVGASTQSFSAVDKKAKSIAESKMQATKDPSASLIRLQDVLQVFATSPANQLNYQHATSFEDLEKRITEIDTQLSGVIHQKLGPLFQSTDPAVARVNEMAAKLVSDAAGALK